MKVVKDTRKGKITYTFNIYEDEYASDEHKIFEQAEDNHAIIEEFGIILSKLGDGYGHHNQLVEPNEEQVKVIEAVREMWYNTIKYFLER